MAATVAQLLARARAPLNDDAAPQRWSDTELLGYLNEAIALVRKSRPDLFLATLLTEPVVALNDATVPVPYTHYQTLVDYVTGRAQMRDGDQTGAKAADLLGLAVQGIK